MDDPPSTQAVSGYNLASKKPTTVSFSFGAPGHCHFCGRSGIILNEFARRGYGKGSFEAIFL
jgi:hypothetical protein